MNSSKKAQNDRNGRTRERILDEAEDLFAHKGYHAVSIREITQAADCNLAAVNYHFGNKQNLYLEVFQDRWLPRAARVHESFRKSLAASGSLSPTVVIESLARAFLDGPLSEEERNRHHQLISSELAQPTEALDLVANQAFRPLFQAIFEDLRRVMPDDVEEERLVLDIISIFALVLYFNFARPLITGITESDYNHEFKSRLVKHIVDFSLNGLGAEKREEING